MLAYFVYIYILVYTSFTFLLELEGNFALGILFDNSLLNIKVNKKNN